MTDTAPDTDDVTLPINILGYAEVQAFRWREHEVVALVFRSVKAETGEENEPFLLFIAPEDAGPLGRLLVSVASPLKPVKKKESK